MRKVVVTAVGKDRPGIVSAVTGVLYKNDCNIEDTSMTILESEFAMIMIIALPKKISIGEFQKSFSGVEKELGLAVATKELSEDEQLRPTRPENIEPYIVSVLGADKAGIVHKVSKLLSDHKFNITDVNSRIIGEEGKNVFALVMEVDIPKSFDIDTLKKEYESLGKELKVEIKVKRIESLKL